MKTMLVSIVIGAGALLGTAAHAAAPAGATAECKDGTYFTGTSHKGACRGHKGVKMWLDKSAASSSAKSSAKTTKPKKSRKSKAKEMAPAAAPMPTAAPAAMPKREPMPAPTAKARHAAPTPASQIAQKPGGGAGMVWVNASSKVYHCQGDEWYGKTKQGSYMSEAAAKAAGNHPAHGKACSK